MNVGTQLGRYRFLREIGGGGLAQVFEAEDTIIGRRVALKVLALPPGIADPDRSLLIQSFQQEARSAGTLSHTNVVTLYEVGEANGTYSVATELLTGTTLREMLREGEPIPVEQALYILLQVARALDYAHKAGVVHGSVKPAEEPFGVLIVEVGEASPTTTPTVATNYVLNDFELTPGSWQGETEGLRLDRARGGGSQAAYWLRASGVQIAPGESVAISCLPETRDWSRFGGIISLDVLVPGTAPPDLRLTVEVEDSAGGLHTMPGEGVVLTPGRWAAITWQAGPVAKDVARLRVKLLAGQTPYRGYFGIDHVRAQGAASSPAAIRYKVRVGPFTDTAVLERETARLKSLGKSPFPVREGEKRYLQVGAFTTIDSARRELDALVAQGYREVR